MRMYLYKNYCITCSTINMKEEKKSIIKEALTDYNAIVEAAGTNAKNKLAEEFPEKFNNLIKEELKNKNKSAKESYKKIDKEEESDNDDADNNKESVMKNQEKETSKVVKENQENEPFTEKAKGVEAVKEEREKEFMGDVESDTPNKGEGEAEKGDRFTDKLKGPSSGKPMPNLTEEFDVTELDIDGVGSAIEGAEDDDEFITIDEIEREIQEMEELSGVPEIGSENNDFDINQKLSEMKNTLDEMIKNLNVDEQKAKSGQQNFAARNQMGNDGGHAGMTTNLIDEDDVDEQKRMGGKQSIPGRESGGPTQSMIDEEDPITDDDVMRVLGSNDSDIEESMEHTQTHDIARKTGANNHTNYGKAERLRYAMKETETKINSLILENKKVTKKLNENLKFKKTATTLIEQYKTALGKYRNQLKEMAIFNTNLAHVNNLLVNEELALTQEDKVKIINEFKKIQTITESQDKYKSLLTEMKGSKKTLSENIEEKVSVSIQPSSKQKLDEVKEKTVYENNEHINKMKKLIEYVENRDKKIIR